MDVKIYCRKALSLIAALLLCGSVLSCLPELELPACNTVADCPVGEGWLSCSDGLCFKFGDEPVLTSGYKWPPLADGELVAFDTPTPAPMSWHSTNVVMAVQLGESFSVDLEFSLDTGSNEEITSLKKELKVVWNDDISRRSVIVPVATTPLDAVAWDLVVLAKSGDKEKEIRSPIRVDRTRPVLILDSPTPTYAANGKTVKMAGRLTDEQSGPKHVVVSCDCEQKINSLVAASDGDFDTEIKVTPGEDIVLEFVGVDRAGNKTEPIKSQIVFN